MTHVYLRSIKSYTARKRFQMDISLAVVSFIRSSLSHDTRFDVLISGGHSTVEFDTRACLLLAVGGVPSEQSSNFSNQGRIVDWLLPSKR